MKRFGLGLVALALAAPLLGGCYVESGYGYYHRPVYHRYYYPRRVHRVVVVGQNDTNQPTDPTTAAPEAPPPEQGSL